jgi:hypothetical protein
MTAWRRARYHEVDVRYSYFLTQEEGRMLAKKTSKNQLTLPKAIVARFPGCEYFEVSTDGSSIVLRPLEPSRAAAVRDRLGKLGLSEQDVSDAVAWARTRQ